MRNEGKTKELRKKAGTASGRAKEEARELGVTRATPLSFNATDRNEPPSAVRDSARSARWTFHGGTCSRAFDNSAERA